MKPLFIQVRPHAGTLHFVNINHIVEFYYDEQRQGTVLTLLHGTFLVRDSCAEIEQRVREAIQQDHIVSV